MGRLPARRPAAGPWRGSRHSERACISSRLPAIQPISDEHNVAIWTRRGAVGGASAEKKRDMGRADEGSLYFSLLHAILCVFALKTASRVLKAGIVYPPTGRSSSPGSIHSSMSESEKERIEIDNRKRRIRKTQRKMTQRCGRNRSNSSSPGRKSEKKAHTAAQKLRQQMQKALKKTAAQLKADEEERVKDQERERKIREEQLLEEARILRRREREKEREPDKDDREKQSTQRAYV
ncbi:splicing factor, variant [Ditylenchus destructor]|nr:splicing factor, variant [Ditylenchus destructor]